jgi:hypothetical protein
MIVCEIHMRSHEATEPCPWCRITRLHDEIEELRKQKAHLAAALTAAMARAVRAERTPGAVER